MNINSWRQLDIRIYAVAASVLVSVLTILVPDTPNDDAYVYIRTAEIALSDGIATAFQHYEWASYSLLIAALGKLGLDLFTAAYLINALFYGIVVFTFVSIVKEIENSRLVLAFATITVLVYPQLNEYRYLIIRDIGFWSFSLFALWQFLLYARSHSLGHAAGYCASLLLAASFRAEAMVYLLLTPLALLFDTRYARKECLRVFFRLIGMVAITLVLSLLLLATLGFDIGGLFLDFVSVYEPFVNNTFNPDQAEVSELGRALFGEYAASYSQEYITAFMATGLLAILAANLFNGIGGPYLWVLVYGFATRQLKIARSVAVPVLVFLLINTAILFVFLFITRYLSSRYAMLFSLLLALFVPMILARVWAISIEKQQTLVTRFLIIFLAYCAFDSYLSFGESKDYVFDSIEWITEQSSETTGVVTNSHAVAYFTGRVENYDETLRFLTEQEIIGARENDLIVVEMHYEMTQLVSSASIENLLELEVAFPSNQDQRLAIFRRVNP